MKTPTPFRQNTEPPQAPPPHSPRNGKPRGGASGLCLFLLLVIGGLCFLFFVNPGHASHFVPQCPFKLLTGLSCPGCGFQRSMHALLHGEFLDALRYNYFNLFALPYLSLLAVAEWGLRGERRERWRRTLARRELVLAYLSLFLFWWVLRNVLGI